MKPLKINEIVRAVRAIDYTSSARFDTIDHVTFDSRLVRPHTLFVPLVGGQTDGHDYAQHAIDNGAKAMLWSRSLDEAPKDTIIILVDDTLKAFQDLARYYRDTINPLVVGITGSNGKTTTKDMVASVLATNYTVHKTQGNYNNEIGLPQTILNMDEATNALVLELGMSEFGEIDVLAEIARPDMAIITLIGESHLENLGSREGIAREKATIINCLPKEGTLIIPQNEPLLRPYIREDLRVITFETESALEKSDEVNTTEAIEAIAHNHLMAKEVVMNKRMTQFKVNNVSFTIPVIGLYNVNNALAALGVLEALDLPIEQAKHALSEFDLTRNRGEWVEGINGTQLLNDAYNASPTSMRAILESFQQTGDSEHANRRIVVLGDMRELGPQSKAFHAGISQALNPVLIDHIYLFGTEMGALNEELQAWWPENCLTYIETDHKQLINRLKTDLVEGDDVLFKASFGTDLLSVVEALRKV
ncbi:UDP-N-acetylmuramoyl-tripeptide--D-alanyl-D-alanine ligase [Atopobacter phocae]|uniref:UDP-N-acetylmuramoyl-tripeptide--D-alanyl-D- alanine ligase n=1 Tax=Atopobacter phocae TaxID=136492 RepID=UPI000471BAE5|nr:UDP-N-acetylmuramoyl-tripeptide--D-alanyl-D-alanine ligase [Atopobacter phocae]